MIIYWYLQLVTMDTRIVLKETNESTSPSKKRKGREPKYIKQEPEQPPEGIVVVPVRKSRKGSKWQGSGFITKRGDQILSYTSHNKITYRKGGKSSICIFGVSYSLKSIFDPMGIPNFNGNWTTPFLKILPTYSRNKFI